MKAAAVSLLAVLLALCLVSCGASAAPSDPSGSSAKESETVGTPSGVLTPTDCTNGIEQLPDADLIIARAGGKITFPVIAGSFTVVYQSADGAKKTLGDDAFRQIFRFLDGRTAGDPSDGLPDAETTDRFQVRYHEYYSRGGEISGLYRVLLADDRGALYKDDLPLCVFEFTARERAALLTVLKLGPDDDPTPPGSRYGITVKSDPDGLILSCPNAGRPGETLEILTRAGSADIELHYYDLGTGEDVLIPCDRIDGDRRAYVFTMPAFTVEIEVRAGTKDAAP
ncbi:MAG: hypothetical protein IJU52_04890 [Clostridia bacterium]|nr:hypothetical protein [Clostridia bacterium]